MYFLSALLNVAFLLMGSIPASLPTPQEENQMTLVQDDLDYAVDLARYRYFDLANEYVNQIRKGTLTDEEKEILQITNASILKLASEYSTDENERLDFYKQAIEQFKKLPDVVEDPELLREIVEVVICPEN